MKQNVLGAKEKTPGPRTWELGPMPTEHYQNSKVIKYFKKLGYAWKINDNFAGGVPDIFIEGLNDLWLEGKRIHPVPKKESTIIDLCHPKKYLSPLQQQWIRRRYAAKCHTSYDDVGIILYTDAHGWAFLPGISGLEPRSWGEWKLLLKNSNEILKEIENHIGFKVK